MSRYSLSVCCLSKIQSVCLLIFKIQFEAQKSVNVLGARIKELEEKLEKKDDEQKDSLNKKNKNHVSTPNKPDIECIYCDKVLFSDYGLVRHIRSKHSKI